MMSNIYKAVSVSKVQVCVVICLIAHFIRIVVDARCEHFLLLKVNLDMLAVHLNVTVGMFSATGRIYISFK